MHKTNKTIIIKLFIFSIVLILFIGAVTIFRVSQAGFLREANPAQPANAVFQVEPNPTRQIYMPLNGVWEYYPDLLLYTENTGAPQAAENTTPLQATKDITSPQPTDNTADNSALPQAAENSTFLQPQLPDPVLIRVPCDPLSAEADLLSSGGKGSFRILLKDVPFMGENNIGMYMSNLSADYTVFMNGKPLHTMLPNPNAYQIYLINDTGDVEIVIETTRGMQGINILPWFGYITHPMYISDNFKNNSLILLSLFLVIFVMFLIFFSSSYDRQMRPAFVLGLVLAITNTCNIMWGLGFADQTDGIIPFSLIQPLVLSLELLASALALRLFYLEHPSDAGKKLLKLELAGILISWILILISTGFLGIRVLYMAGLFFLLAAIVIWIVSVYRRILNDPKFNIILPLVLMFLLCAVLINLLQWNTCIWLNAFYIFPGGIGIYLIYCFYKYSHYKREQVETTEKLLSTTQRLLETEKYASKTQAALLASQIQPHFLSNTLLTIQNLCRTDPEMASRLIVRFSNYLRHNIDFMNYTELIPFAKELEHVDNFIYIQQARFREKLNYEEQIDYRDFEIPPLTVQPIVENAVKYGVRNSINGGTVLLKVWKDQGQIHILVNNDAGPAFNPDTAELRSLNNIRERLKNLVDGSLDIQGKNPEGTTVEIVIPSGKNNHKE